MFSNRKFYKFKKHEEIKINKFENECIEIMETIFYKPVPREQQN